MDTNSKVSETSQSPATEAPEGTQRTTSELERAIIDCALTVQRPSLGTVDSIERVAVMVKYKQPFLDWIAKTGDGETFNADDIGGQIYLLPFHDDIVAEDVLHTHWQTIMENELDSWCSDDSTWPKPLSTKLFKSWLHTEVVDMVFDVDAGMSDEDGDENTQSCDAETDTSLDA